MRNVAEAGIKEWLKAAVKRVESGDDEWLSKPLN